MRNLQSDLMLVTTVLGLLCSGIVSAQAPDNADVQTLDTNASAAIGTYVGMFGPHKITVSIEKIVGRTVMGYSVVTGNERAFSGAWQALPDGIAFIGKEPGDHPDDGLFNLSFNAKEKTLSGNWVANDRKKPGAELILKERKFKYDPKVGSYSMASTRLLKVADVENLLQEELRLMRNEIYARHGYSFIIEDMQKHFATVDWYMPVALDVADRLTPLEIKNAALIKQYENYSGKYYDRFGR